MHHKPVILTGLRANNDLHIGNYFGALLPFIDMARSKAGDYQLNLFVPDLHSFTTPIDHTQLHNQIMHNLKLFVAAGLDLDNPDIYLYRQSYVPAHAELTWILDCFTGFGQMRRMTQFKDKSAKLTVQETALTPPLIDIERDVSVGLFNYPVLMAADILLYGASYVPVGEDQSQHLEFTRDIAERMNRRFADVFPENIFKVPEPVANQHEFFAADQGLRIRDLNDPGKKMSKSDELGKGVIFLGDDPAAAAKKVMSATTDSLAMVQFDLRERPGVSNLLQILALLDGRPVSEITSEWKDRTSYGELKTTVADKVYAFLTDFQSKLTAVDESAILRKLETSETAMNEVANTTLLRAQQAVGLRPRS